MSASREMVFDPEAYLEQQFFHARIKASNARFADCARSYATLLSSLAENLIVQAQGPGWRTPNVARVSAPEPPSPSAVRGALAWIDKITTMYEVEVKLIEAARAEVALRAKADGVPDQLDETAGTA